MTTNTIKVYLENDNMGGALNPSIVGFTYQKLVDGDTDSMQARIMAYFKLLVQTNIICTTKIARMTDEVGQVGPGGGSVDLSYPTDAAVALNPFLGTAIQLDYTAFPLLGNSQNLTVRGSSINVNEFTANPGRKGQGRHYIPFLSQGELGFDGIMGPNTATFIERAYSALFLGADDTILGKPVGNPITAENVGVRSGDNTFYPIAGVKVNRSVTVLKSRRK